MEPPSKGKQVLSDIEQSVQNALALFNSENGILSEHLPVLDDPIIALHDPATKDYLKKEEDQEFTHQDINKITFKEPTFFQKIIPNINFGNFFSSYANQPIDSIKKSFSHESDHLPFSEDPIKSSVEQMQKLLNEKGVLFKEQNEPSPEEILNLYSEDLGIQTSTNKSPRKDVNDQLTENEPKASNQDKKDKKHMKTTKQTKLPVDKKTTVKKKDISKSTVFSIQEKRMNELMNIYGCSNKVVQPHSDSTLGSKYETNKKNRPKKLKKSDESSKSSSTAAPSRKSKRKIKRDFAKSNIDIYEGDFSNLEKSSRISTKRKLKQKSNSGIMKIKSLNQKRKRGSVFSNDNPTLNHNINSLHKEEFLNQKNKQHAQIKSNTSKTATLPISNKPQYTNSTHAQNLIMNDDMNKLNNGSNNESVLNRKSSKEGQLNKHVFFNDSIDKAGHLSNTTLDQNIAIPINQIVTDCNLFDDDFGGHQTLHYALPTHSSRSKEVERFLNGHYQHLPFVIGQSTNKSHNLWVNIQEALSLIKQKVPQANDIQSVLQSSVVSEKTPSIFSKMSTKSSKKPHQCPATMTDSLYDIPENINETEDKDYSTRSWENHPECMKANIDPNYCKSRCSCLTQPSVSYRKVLRQIFGGISDGSDMSVDTINRRDDFLQDSGGDSYTAELRKALISFTQEFEEMNIKYDEMSSDPNTSKDELQRLEMQLVDKEEELRELIARFNEVKEFSEKAKEGGKNKAGYYSLESFKSTTSIRLAQTLRRVQKFKESLKSKPSVPFLSKSIYLQTSY